ncbi:MAG: hypothetical protein KAR17_06295 [Cyclobacteriaceae bacterium]|nr:hypothetical protein [Cyclobacteriaceae bacterium]
MKPFLKNWMVLWLFISITLLPVNASLVLINSFRIDKLNKKKEQILIMMKNVDDLQNSTIHGLDLGIRGFAISKKKEMLAPFEEAISFNGGIFKSLYRQTEIFNYPKENIDSLNSLMSGYINFSIYLKSLIEQDSLSKFKEILSTDPGLFVWRKYNYYEKDIFRHLGKARNELDKEIDSSLTENLVLQILVIVLIVPSIILIFFKLNKLKKDISNHNTLVIQKKSELQNSRDFLSHVIRGPICRLQGLFYLLERDKVTEKKLLLEKIEQVALEIDELTKNISN